MGKFDFSLIRTLTQDDFRVMVAVEMGMRNHEYVPLPLVASIASLRHGGCHKCLSELSKHKLVRFTRSHKAVGYCLTFFGYDYLALHSLARKDLLYSVGIQIGCGKESNVFLSRDSSDQNLILKVHRLGRTCFRTLKKNRDYLKNRHASSWIYLSRLSAYKEFCYMKALHENGFNIPVPIGCNRSIVLMEYVEGRLLHEVFTMEFEELQKLYHSLMELILKFASYGLIHGDFNEFNILIKNCDSSVCVIDFPQMVSISHPNAEWYFDRDVKGIRDFFRKQFSYENEYYPKFSDIQPIHCLDKKLRASGYKGDRRNLDLSELFILNNSNDNDDDASENESDSKAAKNSGNSESETSTYDELSEHEEELLTYDEFYDLKDGELNYDLSRKDATLRLHSTEDRFSNILNDFSHFNIQEENDGMTVEDDRKSVSSYYSCLSKVELLNVMKKHKKSVTDSKEIRARLLKDARKRARKQQEKRIRSKGEISLITKRNREDREAISSMLSDDLD